MAKKIRACVCEICHESFESTSNARACPGECRTTLFRLIGKGEKPKTDKPTGSLQSAALRKEQDEAKQKNLFLLMPISNKSLQKTY